MHEDTNHYIPDTHNAHIDTGNFESELNDLFGSLRERDLEKAKYWPDVYEKIISKIDSRLSEPNDSDLVCRYLTPAKFLWFAHQSTVYFGSAIDFEDRRDSEIPDDYKHSVQKLLFERGVNPLAWDDYLDRMRSRWLVSCWTSLDNHYDDYLLWHRYAGSALGIGIVITYGELKKHLYSKCSYHENVKAFHSGHVGYSHPLQLPPFNKRNIFRNEKEVRFVCETDLLASMSIDISPLKERFSLRFSPDAPTDHIDAILAVWRKMGGGSVHHISGS